MLYISAIHHRSGGGLDYFTNTSSPNSLTNLGSAKV
jgi:hypothetical protein